MKKWRNWLILLAIIGLLAYSIGLWRARISRDQQTANSTTNTETGTNNVSEGVGGDNLSPVDQNGTTSSDNQTSDNVLKRVTYSAANLNEAQAVNIVNDFEQALNQKNQTGVASLFDQSAAPEQIPPGTFVDQAPFPISFTFNNVEIRGDTSAIVTVSETWLDPTANIKNTRRRLFELYPNDNNYKIGKYFTDDATDPLSGFTSSL